MTSFSIFIYYTAQLTIQLEMSKLGLFGKCLHPLTLADIDEDNSNEQRRQMLLHGQAAQGEMGGAQI